MCFHGVNFFHRWVLEHFDLSWSCGEEKEVALGVPANLVHLHLELHIPLDLEGPSVDEADLVIFVSNGNLLTVGTPADVDILPASVDRVDALSGFLLSKDMQNIYIYI